jgi:hypothetical protein
VRQKFEESEEVELEARENERNSKVRYGLQVQVAVHFGRRVH